MMKQDQIVMKDLENVISDIQKIDFGVAIFQKQLVENCLLIDLIKIYDTKLKLDDKFKIYYDKRPCKIYIENVPANIIKRHHLKKNVYLQIMSIGLSSIV